MARVEHVARSSCHLNCRDLFACRVHARSIRGRKSDALDERAIAFIGVQEVEFWKMLHPGETRRAYVVGFFQVTKGFLFAVQLAEGRLQRNRHRTRITVDHINCGRLF